MTLPPLPPPWIRETMRQRYREAQPNYWVESQMRAYGAACAAAAKQRPLTKVQLWSLPEMRGWFPQDHYRLEAVARAIEAAHGITGEQK